MLLEFKSHIEKHFPILLQKPFLLACSGGVDSMVLTSLCSKLNLNFAVAHCNFNLRGNESNEDENLVRSTADKINKTCHVIHFDTKNYISENKLSVQEGARKLRYNWFYELVEKHNYGAILTAHHADDNLETFLINLSRGTGIDGLTGIPERNEKIMRPLLTFSQQQIMDYAKEEALAWREDSSNADTKYLRNKIRHSIVPALKELHPTFLDNFNKTKDYLIQTSSINKTHIVELKKELFQYEEDVIKIEILKLQKLNPLEGYIYALFSAYGFSEWNNIIDLLSASSGKEVYSKTHRLLKDRNFLLLQELKTNNSISYKLFENETIVKIPFKMVIEDVDAIKETSKNILYLDKEKLKYPLEIRKWKKGDYFYPIGMNGKKKVSKFFKDEKVDQISKENQWFLCSNNKIVWIIGKRADERFKVTNATKIITKFTVK